MLLDDAGAEGHSTEGRRKARGVIGEPEDDLRERPGVFGQNPEVDMFEVLDVPRVVRIALEKDEGRIDRENRFDGPLHVSEVGGARREDHGFPGPRDLLEDLEPSDVTRPDLEARDVGIQHVHRLEVVRRGEVGDAGVVARLP